MARGRKKLPTQLKVLKGTLRNHREKTPGMVEPDPAQSGLKMPDHFSDLEAAVWNAHAQDLHASKLLRDVDYPQFIAFCVAVATMLEMKATLARDGKIIMGTFGPVKHPAWAILKDAMVFINKFGSEFGLSPAARARVKVPEPKPDNPLKAFLGPKR